MNGFWTNIIVITLGWLSLLLTVGVLVHKGSKWFHKMESDTDWLKSDVGVLKSGVGTLESDVDTLKSDVGTLKSDVGMLKSDVDTLKSDVDTLKSDVSVLKSDVGTLKLDVGVLKVGMSDIQTDIRRIGDYLFGHSKPFAGRSPTHLNGKGKKMLLEIDGVAWAKRLAAALVGEVKDLDEYQTQEFCYNYVRERLEMTDEQASMVRKCAYENASDLDETLHVLAIQLRDNLLMGARGAPVS